MAPTVSVTGYVDDGELDRLMAGADCLVFPSLFEGFAIPVVEAMARGIPVACSRAASLPEVGGDLACYFDPRDAGSIADAVRRAIELRKDAEFCSKLRRQAAKFSFERTTRRILRWRSPSPRVRPDRRSTSFGAGNGRLIPLSGDLPAPGDLSWRPFPSADCVWVDAGISRLSRDAFVERVGLAEARSLHPSQCGDLWIRRQSNGVPKEGRYEEMLSRVARGDLVVRVRTSRGAPKRISWPGCWAVLASQLRITGGASPEAWNAALGFNWHWSRLPGVIASKFFRKRTGSLRNFPKNGLPAFLERPQASRPISPGTDLVPAADPVLFPASPYQSPAVFRESLSGFHKGLSRSSV